MSVLRASMSFGARRFSATTGSGVLGSRSGLATRNSCDAATSEFMLCIGTRSALGIASELVSLRRKCSERRGLR